MRYIPVMGVTANYSFPYPELGDAPDGPAQIRALAQAVDTVVDTIDDRVDTIEILRARGIVARHRRTSSGTSTTSATAGTAQAVVQLDSVSFLTGRLYRISCPNLGFFTGAAAVAQAQINYTDDGSAPTVASTQLVETQVETPAGGIVVHVALESFISAPSSATYRFLLSCWGDGTLTTMFGSTAWPIELIIEDMGADVGSTGINI